MQSESNAFPYDATMALLPYYLAAIRRWYTSRNSLSSPRLTNVQGSTVLAIKWQTVKKTWGEGQVFFQGQPYTFLRPWSFSHVITKMANSHNCLMVSCFSSLSANTKTRDLLDLQTRIKLSWIFLWVGLDNFLMKNSWQATAPDGWNP